MGRWVTFSGEFCFNFIPRDEAFFDTLTDVVVTTRVKDCIGGQLNTSAKYDRPAVAAFPEESVSFPVKDIARIPDDDENEFSYEVKIS